MKINKKEFARRLSTNGGGAFGKVEYNGNESVILRTNHLKTPDRGTPMRLYFDKNREQIMTGRRYDIVGDLLLMRRNQVYRVYTTLIVKSLPDGVTGRVELTEDAKHGIALLSYSIVLGEPVAFTVLSFRGVETAPYTSLANLVFDWEFDNSGRTKKENKPDDKTSDDDEELGTDGKNDEESEEEVNGDTI